MALCDGNASRSRVKFYLLITLLLLGVIALGIYLIWLRDNSYKYLPDEEEDDDSPPEDLSCDQLTRTRSQDEFWNCLVYGPTKFLLPEERAKIDAEYFAPDQDAFRILEKVNVTGNDAKTKTPSGSNNTKILRRVKRRLHGPYQPLNRENFTLEINPAKETSLVRSPANDPFFFEPIYIYKPTHETWQFQPPWSYTGDFGVKKWHTLDLEKFIVPINNENLDLNKEDRLMRAVFTNLWDEHKLIHPDEFKFRQYFFENRTIREKYALSRFLYNIPYEDTRLEGFDIVPPKVIQQKLFNVSDDKDWGNFKIDASLRALTNFYKPRKRVDDSPESARDEKDFTGYYSYMRYYLSHRPSDEEIARNPDVLSASFKRNVFPPKGAKFLKLINLLVKQDEHFKEKHPLTEEEQKVLYLFGTIAGQYGWKYDPELVDFSNNKVSRSKQLENWARKEFEDSQFEQESSQSKYSIDIFPVKLPICSDKEPSPLDIWTEKAKKSSLPPYGFNENGDRYYRFFMYLPEDGTSNVFVLFEDAVHDKEKEIRLTHGPTRSLQPLYFEIMNFKIGMHRGKGSEHKLNGKAYDMELQLMFTVEGQSGEQPYWFTLARQLNDLFPFRGKLVHIISVFVEVDDNLAPDSPEALVFEPFAQTAYQIRKQIEANPNGDHYRTFRMKDFAVRLTDFIPKNSAYYNYRGGLTMPPCFSYVTWSVYEKPLKIMPQQFTELKFIRAPAEKSGFIAGNIRTADDIWTSYENEPGLLKSEREQRKQDRMNRAVLKSIDENDGSNSDLYDYYFDYDGGTLYKPNVMLMSILILLVGLILVFQI